MVFGSSGAKTQKGTSGPATLTANVDESRYQTGSLEAGSGAVNGGIDDGSS